MKKYAIYIRVSTQKQGVSGLGLESQKKICEDYVQSVKGEVIAEFKDVESGKHRDRPGLIDAVNFCKANKCTLLLATLSRLARDVEFTFKIVNSGIDIHFVDMPEMNTLTLGIFATVAQYERELTSERTKKALKAKKDRGFKLGAQKGIDTTKAWQQSAKVKRERAQKDPNNRIIWEMFTQAKEFTKDGKTPTSKEFERISGKLNRIGIRTSQGMDFTPERARSAYHNLKRTMMYSEI